MTSMGPMTGPEEAPMTDSLASLAKERLALEQALKELDRKEARLKREAEEWVSAEEARNILAQVSDPNGTLPYSRLLPIMKTLVSLRPEPDNESDVYLTWATPKDEDSMFQADQFSVSLDLIHEEILLNDDYEQVAHTLSTEEAELLGRRLLGAAEASRKPLGE